MVAKRKKKPRYGRIAASLVILLTAALLAMILLNGYLEKREYQLLYEKNIVKWAREYDLDPYLVAAIIHVESGNRTDAVSQRGALGLMQLMPTTAEWIAGKLNEEYDSEAITLPDKNIQYGCWYLNFLFARFPDTDTVCAAYNAGHNAVSGWLNDPQYSENGKTLAAIPYPETENYVEKVMRAYDKYQELYPEAFD